MRRLFGFLSYFQAYIQDFSRVAQPLFEFLQVKPEMSLDSPSRRKIKGPQVPSRIPIVWTRDHQQTLEGMINVPINPLY